MPTLKNLLAELKRLAVSPDDIHLSALTYGKVIDRAERMIEEGEDEAEDED